MLRELPRGSARCGGAGTTHGFQTPEPYPPKHAPHPPSLPLCEGKADVRKNDNRTGSHVEARLCPNAQPTGKRFMGGSGPLQEQCLNVESKQIEVGRGRKRNVVS